MIVFIITYNRFTLPVNLANWCASKGLTPVFVDNASDYVPLLEYYKRTQYEVIRLDKNYGHRAVWEYKRGYILKNHNLWNDRYVVTDPDLDLSEVPDDFMEILHGGLDKYPQYWKCGLSLKIDDLPHSKEGNFIRNHVEPQYWKNPVDDMYFHAPVDTTFALHREGTHNHVFIALRTNKPYTARHLPWYYINFNDLPVDEQYYFQTASKSCSGKERMLQL